MDERIRDCHPDYRPGIDLDPGSTSDNGPHAILTTFVVLWEGIGFRAVRTASGP